jgi:hypothetical protein
MTNRDQAAWTDEMLEQDVEQALAVEPSPEFLARVRTHIASVPNARRWPTGWPLVALSTTVAGIVLLVAAIAISGLKKPRTVVAPEPPSVVVRQTEPPVAPPSVTPMVRHPEVHRAPRSRAPEVLIPAGEAAVLRRLMRGLQTGTVERSTLASAQGSAIAPPATDIVLKPLAPLTPVALEPLESLTRQEGVRQ